MSPALKPVVRPEEDGSREHTCRGRVLEAARRVLYRMGAAATTLEEVAREAGTTRGGIYCHFSSKETLILAVVTRWPLPSLEGEEDGADPLVGLDRALCRLVGQLRGDRALNEMLCFLMLKCDDAVCGGLRGQVLDVFWRRLVCQIEDVYRRARVRGLLHPCLEPLQAAEETLVFLKGLLETGMFRLGKCGAATLEAAIGIHIHLRHNF